MGVNVHVHDARRLVKEVMVDGRLLHAALLKPRHHRRDFVLGEHEITHRHRTVAMRLERHPRA